MIYLVLFTHWVADFICQTDKMAKGKSTSLGWLSSHIFVYTLVMMIFGWKFAIVNGAIHFVVDFFTSRVTSYLWKKGEVHNFFVVIGLDQLIHTSCLVFTIPMINFWGF